MVSEDKEWIRGDQDLWGQELCYERISDVDIVVSGKGVFYKEYLIEKIAK